METVVSQKKVLHFGVRQVKMFNVKLNSCSSLAHVMCVTVSVQSLQCFLKSLVCRIRIVNSWDRDSYSPGATKKDLYSAQWKTADSLAGSLSVESEDHFPQSLCVCFSRIQIPGLHTQPTK